ncbi:hypothetical protein [Paraburkholderia sp. J41]|uniref:nuclear transport factor 2 family protein n=1 Tax=Paraburkholderia sp. J41 TaxID=2805433 RepID=UPI002AC359AB|nr:hypothetical protein [Paraburkholderia sp. J41]
MNFKSKKDRSVAIQQSLMNGGALYPLSFFDSRRYIQHNPVIEDGVGPILQFMDRLPAGERSVRSYRAIEDGDYSVVHNDYRLGEWGAMAAFEVHRWENDRIVEHWDNLQALSTEPNVSGRTMIDGASQVTDHASTASNKALIERFIREVLIGGSRTLASFFAGNALIQHSPHYGDGVDALLNELSSRNYIYERLHKVLGEGNFVLAMSEGIGSRDSSPPKQTSFYDLYRLADGVIAEHWEVVETIAPLDQWRNTNGKF